MKAAPFDYTRVDSVRSCIRALDEAGGDAKIIAGGQSLAPVLAMRLARPSLVVDINRIPGLASITRTGDDTMSLGALVRHSDLVEQQVSPLLAEAARWIGHAAIRSRGTTGGSIAHADPAAELPVVASALEATVVVAGPNAQREVPSGDFFEGPLESALTENEMIVRVDLPIPETWGFAELSRRHGDFGLVTVVTALVRGEWRVSVGGVAGVPHRPEECEAVLNGGPPDERRAREAARAAAAGIQVASDLHASAAYRKAMVQEFAFRSITQALEHAMAGVS